MLNILAALCKFVVEPKRTEDVTISFAQKRQS